MTSKKLYVGNISYSATSDEIKNLIADIAEVASVHIFEDKGFGFVEFNTNEDAEKVLNELNGKDFKGRPLKIDFARPKTNGPRPQRSGDGPRRF